MLEPAGRVLVDPGLVQAVREPLGLNLLPLDVDPHPRVDVQDGRVRPERLSLRHETVSGEDDKGKARSKKNMPTEIEAKGRASQKVAIHPPLVRVVVGESPGVAEDDVVEVGLHVQFRLAAVEEFEVVDDDQGSAHSVDPVELGEEAFLGLEWRVLED